MDKIFSRRELLKLGGRVLVSLGLGNLLAKEHQALAKEMLPAQNIRQLITADARTSRTLMWQAERALEAVRLEYRPVGGQKILTAAADYDYLRLGEAACCLHTAQINNLTPDKKYEYRLAQNEVSTAWRPLVAAPRDDFQMLIFTDSQCVDYNCWRQVATAAFSRHPNANIFTCIGDLTDNGQALWQWQGWMNGLADYSAAKIFVPVMGNHECYDLNWQMCLPEGYLHQFVQPTNGSAKFTGYYYSFDYGQVHFIVLNTQMEELDGVRPGLLAEELSWLERDLAQNKQPWRIVLMHKDVLTYELNPLTGRQGGINEIGQAFMPAFDKHGIDLVLTGHLHTYRNRGHIYSFAPAEKGPVYVLCGLAGDCRYDNIWVDPVFDKYVAPQPETDNYLLLTANRQRLKLECYLPNGTLLDKLDLKKT